jgi:hypothetical protein
MIFICGDTHGEIDIGKLEWDNWSNGHELTKDDILIVLGDFGLFWDDSDEEKKLRKELDHAPWTTWFIPGNHENFDILDKFPIEEHGEFLRLGTTPYEHIKMICHGSIIEAGEKKIFCFGGGLSIDKENRREGISWWKQEIPSFKDQERAFENLERVGNKVDIILTHAIFESALQKLFNDHRNDYFEGKLKDPVCKILQEVKKRAEYKSWYCGHYHQDKVMPEYKLTFMYNQEPIRIV